MSAADPDAHLNELPTLEESAALGSNSPVTKSRSNSSNSRSSSSSRNESNASFSSETNPESLSLDPCATGDDEPEVVELLRMWRAGEIEPVPVELPPLPENATEPMRLVAAFFADLRGLRLWAGDDRPVMLSGRFVGGELRIPPRTAARALSALGDVKGAGVLRLAGAMPSRRPGQPGTALYLPGHVGTAAVGVEAAAEVVGDPDEPHVHVVDEPLMVGAELAGRQRSFATAGDGTRDVLRGGVEEAFDPGRHPIGSTASPCGTHPSQAWSDPEELVAALVDAFDAEEIPPDGFGTGSGEQEPPVDGKRHPAAPTRRDRRLARAHDLQAGEVG